MADDAVDGCPMCGAGIRGMKVGGQRLLGIPPALGYGAQDRPDIAPDETLWFVVEVLDAR